MAGIRKKQELKNYYEFCYGMNADWVDMDKGLLYHIKEYKDAVEKGQHPKGIRVTKWGSDETIEYIGEYTLRERMKEAEPDPRY